MIAASGHQLRTPNTPDKKVYDTKRPFVGNVTTQLYFCLIDYLSDTMRSIDFSNLRAGIKEIVQKATVWDGDDQEKCDKVIDSVQASSGLADIIWDIAEPYTVVTANVAECKRKMERVIKRHLVD